MQKLLVLIFSVVFLAACNSGSSSSTPSPTPQTSSIILSGVAATGSPLTGATITVNDKTGGAVGTSSPTTGTDGSYTVTLQSTAQPPFVVQASRSDIGMLVSVIPSATAGSTANTVNITPITNLIASRLSVSGDPSKLASEIQAGTATVTAATLQAKITEVLTIFQSIQTAVGDTTTNPITDSSFKADGTKQDAVLDRIKISVNPIGSTATNIQIAISGASSDISFQSGTRSTVAPPPQAPAIDPTAMLPATINPTTLIPEFLDRTNTCLALPTADRVATSNTACKALFWNSDPTTYKTNGANANQAFINLASDNTTGAKFENGSFEFMITNRSATFSAFTTSDNNPFVITARVTLLDGSFSYNTQVVLADPNDGNKLKLIGNQWDYNARIIPNAELREFPGQSQFTYLDTSYEMFVSNSGQFDHVDVTTPDLNGNIFKFTLIPKPGLSFLAISAVNGTVKNTNTDLLRMNGAFVNPTTPGTPELKDTSLFWYPGLLSDETIGSFPLYSEWTFDFFLTADPTTLAKTETRTTLHRALRLDELQNKSWAQLLSPLSTAILSVPSSGIPFSWTVPAGALAPNQLQVFGALPSPGSGTYNDNLSILTSAIQATVTCTPQGISQTHCSSNGVYAANLTANLLSISATDQFGIIYRQLWHIINLTDLFPTSLEFSRLVRE